VAQESGQPELESSLVSRAAYGIHNPALLLALRRPVFCPFRRHELVFDWRGSGDLICLTIEAKRTRYGGKIHLVVPPSSSAAIRHPRPALDQGGRAQSRLVRKSF
jgi:hypothetical protein